MGLDYVLNEVDAGGFGDDFTAGGGETLSDAELAAVSRAVPEAEPGVEGAASPDAGTSAGVPAEGEAAPWAPDPNEWAQVVGFINQIAQTMQQPQPQYDPGWGGAGQQQYQPGYDPGQQEYFDGTDPQQVAQLAQQQAQQAAVQAISPLVPLLEQFQNQQLETYVDGMLDQVVKLPEGTPPEQVQETRQHVNLLATSYLPHFVNQFTGQPMPQQAIQRAAADVAAWEKAIGDRAVARYKGELDGVGNAKGEPGAGGGAVEVATAPKTEEEAALRFVENQGRRLRAAG